MARVLVIGGRGALGHELVYQLGAAGHRVRATSRHPHASSEDFSVEWVQIDLGTGAGLVDALAAMGAVITVSTAGSGGGRRTRARDTLP